MKQTACLAISLIILPMTFSGCATILSGRTQTMTVDSVPSGAKCDVVREGSLIGSVALTPGAVLIEKTKHDLNVVCHKDGLPEARGFVNSGWDGAVIGNIVLGGLPGWAIDSIVGADNRYADIVTVNMTTGTSTTSTALPPPTPTTSETTLASVAKAPTVTSENMNDSVKRLESLKSLRDSGILTEKEYQQKRAEALQKL